jgi:GxxExxY protein
VDENQIGDAVVASAFKVHTILGPGMLECAYETCLAHELMGRGIEVKRQVSVPIEYESVRLDVGYRIDLLAGDLVVIELKAVERLQPIHHAQLLSYLKLSKLRLGYLLNLNVVHMRDGIKRLANGL